MPPAAFGRPVNQGGEGQIPLWIGDDEVAIISKQTGRSAIDVRGAIMKVGR
jgi:hypothetical protein